MITSAEIQLIRNADPGVKLPGIDTPTGNLLPASSLVSYTQVANAPFYYVASDNTVFVTQNNAVLSGIDFGTASVNIDANNVTIKDCTFTGTTGFWGIYQTDNYSGATIQNCTFQGSGAPTEINDWISSTQNITSKTTHFSLRRPMRSTSKEAPSSEITSVARDSLQGRMPMRFRSRNLPARRSSPTISSMGHTPPTPQPTRTATFA